MSRAGRWLLWVFFSALLNTSLAWAQNPIVAENQLPGNLKSEWDISGAGNLTIQGFATDMSVNKGSTVRFKINVNGGVTFGIRIYRLGYYQGRGARLITNLGNFTGRMQPSPISNSSTGLVDCGNWSESASWAVPATAVSGVYIAKLSRSDNNGSSHIVFVVRDDQRNASLLFKTSDATWQAYNVYGGNSLYTGSTSYPSGHAVKVSYNRPFITRNGGGGGGAMEDWLFNAEYPMIRWLERNGYDMSYTTDVDMSRDNSPITPSKHRVLLSVGHDEYWSSSARTRFENARTQGVHLAFFSGNEVYWKTRWENSVDGSSTPYRTLVCYKEGSLGENACGGKCDPQSNTWTGLWRDGCNFGNADGCQPENALTGQISWVDATGSIRVPSTYRNLPIWRNTSIATLANGQSVTFPNGTLGYEWDGRESGYASSYPSNRQVLSSTSLAGKVHELSLYTHSSGAKVFGAGTVQWSWGLDNVHDRGSAAPSRDMQQATVNLLSDMNIEAGSLQSDLVPGSSSADNEAPTTAISSPLNGATLPAGTARSITGTATDTGGGTVTAVDVSTNGGVNWQRATGTTNWTFSWTPLTAGSFVLKSRGIDNSGNTEVPGTPPSANAITVTVTSTPETVPPTVTATSPANGATSVSTTTTITATFNEAIDPTTVNSNTFELRNAANELISAIIDYNAPSRIATLTPSAALTNSTTYTATLQGGATDPSVKDLAGNALAADRVWNFTTAAAAPAGTFTIWNPTTVPGTIADPESRAVELGVKFRATVNGFITGIRFYKSTTNTGTHVATLWSRTGTNLARATFTAETASGWQQVLFTTPVAITAGTTYVASYHTNTGHYSINTNYFTTSVGASPNLQALASGIDGSNGVYRYAANSIFPNSSYISSNYWVDVIFTTNSGAPDTSPPTVTATNPANAATGVSTAATLTATFNEAIDPATLNSATFELRDAANAVISGTISYNATNRIATLTPAAALANSTVYTATLQGGATDPAIKDLAGNALAADRVWSFTTAAATPLTVTASTPANNASGVSTTASITATFNQAIDPNTLNSTTFELRSAANAVVTGTISYNATNRIATLTPAAALANSTAYTATLRGGTSDPRIQTTTGITLAANQVWSFTTAAATPLTVTANTPANNASGVLTTAAITATFNQAIDPNTLNSTTFELRSAANAVITGTISYNATNRIATLTPAAALANSTAYTATLRGGTSDPRIQTTTGITLAADQVWSFTTAAAAQPGTFSIWSPTSVPGTITESDNSAVELGVKFRASVNGFITGIRYYKSASNTGTHIGNLWSLAGTNLARATFTGETASGWQQVLFTTPVAITAGTTYVASYHTPSGNYSVNENYFASGAITSGPLQALANGTDGPNGVYRYTSSTAFPNSSYNSSNYWVDVVFTTNTNPGSMQSALTSISPLKKETDREPLSIVTGQPLPSNDNLRLTSYPNPFSEKATIEFILPANDQKVTLEIYNVKGMKTTRLYQGTATANKPYRFEINSMNMAPGIYFIHLISGQKVESRKIILNSY